MNRKRLKEMKPKKRINSFLYTEGKYQRGHYYYVDTDNKNLYSKGLYKTTITKDDLPDNYIRIFSKSIHYSHGYLKTSGVVDIKYHPIMWNHLFKDDYLYISYNNKIEITKDCLGFENYTRYDFSFCGNDIIPVLLAIEKNSNFDISKIKQQIIDKIEWYNNNYDDEKENPEEIFYKFTENKS